MARRKLPLYFLTLVVFFVAALVLRSPVQAASANLKMNYQGYLQNAADGSPIQGEKGLIFRIRDGEDGSVQWESGCTKVDVVNGLFRSALGLTNTAGWAAVEWDRIDAHLELLVGEAGTYANAVAMRPQERLMASPYSLSKGASSGETALDVSGTTQTKSGGLNVLGNVGIGTAKPGAKLDVAGTVNAAGFSWNGQSLDLRYAPAASGSLWAASGPNIYYNGGNVGIGTTTPAAQLHVQNDLMAGASIGVPAKLDTNYPPGNVTLRSPKYMFLTSQANNHLAANLYWDGARWHRYNTATGGAFWWAGWDGSLETYLTGAGANPVAADSWSNPFWITNAGNVGVGTTSPGHKLQVAGGGGASVDMRVNGRIQTGDAHNWGGVWLDGANTMFVGQQGTNVGFWTSGAGWGGLQVTNAGNVGIGTISPGHKAQVMGGGGGSVDLRVNGRMQTGDAHNAGGVWLDGANTMFVGQHGTNVGFWTSGAGWGGLLVTNAGNVGIGTSNPGAKLDVQGGAIKASGGLIIETRASDPPNPAVGQIWLLTQ